MTRKSSRLEIFNANQEFKITLRREVPCGERQAHSEPTANVSRAQSVAVFFENSNMRAVYKA